LILLLYIVAAAGLFGFFATDGREYTFEQIRHENGQKVFVVPPYVVALDLYETQSFAHVLEACKQSKPTDAETQDLCRLSNAQMAQRVRELFAQPPARNIPWAPQDTRTGVERVFLGASFAVLLAGFLALLFLGWIAGAAWNAIVPAQPRSLTGGTGTMTAAGVTTGFFNFSGQVQSVTEWSETQISGGGSGQYAQPVTSTTTHHVKFFLRDGNGEERIFHLDPNQFPVRAGSTVSVVYATKSPQDAGYGWTSLFYNHDTRTKYVDFAGIHKARGRIIGKIFLWGALGGGAGWLLFQLSGPGTAVFAGLGLSIAAMTAAKMMQMPADRRIADAAYQHLRGQFPNVP
jgi:hypothetical protein